MRPIDCGHNSLWCVYETPGYFGNRGKPRRGKLPLLLSVSTVLDNTQQDRQTRGRNDSAHPRGGSQPIYQSTERSVSIIPQPPVDNDRGPRKQWLDKTKRRMRQAKKPLSQSQVGLVKPWLCGERCRMRDNGVYHSHDYGSLGMADAEGKHRYYSVSVQVSAHDWKKRKNAADRVMGSPPDAQFRPSELTRIYASHRSRHPWPIIHLDIPLHLLVHRTHASSVRHLCSNSHSHHVQQP